MDKGENADNRFYLFPQYFKYLIFCCLLCEKLMPLHLRYNGEVGDIVVGRILEVGMKRWKVDVHSKLNAVLMLSSVNLAGGELVSKAEYIWG